MALRSARLTPCVCGYGSPGRSSPPEATTPADKSGFAETRVQDRGVVSSLGLGLQEWLPFPLCSKLYKQAGRIRAFPGCPGFGAEPQCRLDGQPSGQ